MTRVNIASLYRSVLTQKRFTYEEWCLVDFIITTKTFDGRIFGEKTSAEKLSDNF